MLSQQCYVIQYNKINAAKTVHMEIVTCFYTLHYYSNKNSLP